MVLKAWIHILLMGFCVAFRLIISSCSFATHLRDSSQLIGINFTSIIQTLDRFTNALGEPSLRVSEFTSLVMLQNRTVTALHLENLQLILHIRSGAKYPMNTGTASRVCVAHALFIMIISVTWRHLIRMPASLWSLC